MFAFLLAAAVAGGGEAEAGKGKMSRSAKIERGADGSVTFNERVKHTKGVRARLTGRKAGKVMSVETSQSGSLSQTRVQRRRQRITTNTAATRSGTRSSGAHEKKGLLSRRWRTKMTREDAVRAQSVDEVSSRRRLGGGQSVVERRTGAMGNSQVRQTRMSRKGEIKRQSSGPGGRTGPAYTKKLTGQRAIENGRSGMEIADTQSKRWGVLSRVTGGRLGKKVTVEQRQGVDGTSVTMTTPRASFTRNTVVGEGFTESTGSQSKKNRVFGRTMRERQRDTVRSDASGVTWRREKLRRDGTVKKVVTERVYADGRSRTTTSRLRKDGTVRRVSEKESIESPTGKRRDRNVQRSTRLVRRDGSTRASVGSRRVNRQRSRWVETPVGTLGTPGARITSSARTSGAAGRDQQ